MYATNSSVYKINKRNEKGPSIEVFNKMLTNWGGLSKWMNSIFFNIPLFLFYPDYFTLGG